MPDQLFCRVAGISASIEPSVRVTIAIDIKTVRGCKNVNFKYVKPVVIQYWQSFQSSPRSA